MKASAEDDIYHALKGLPLWENVNQAIEDLGKNRDLIEQTSRNNIVGYIVKKLYILGKIKLPRKGI